MAKRHTPETTYDPYATIAVAADNEDTAVTVEEDVARITAQQAAPIRAIIQPFGSLPELQCTVLMALRGVWGAIDVESGYFGTRYHMTLANGQRATITVQVTDPKI